MPFTINSLYQAVFVSKGVIDISKVPKEKMAEILESRNKAQKERFKEITENQNLAEPFRILLHEVNPGLEGHLYGSQIASLEKSSTFPTDEDIQKKFQALDEQYQYFEKDSSAKNHFMVFFKACKLMADFIEQNNTPDNDVAYLHAYKMLVLFGAGKQNPLSSAETIIKSHGVKFDKPVHDLLVHDIPKNIPPISLAAWQKLIAVSGFKAIEIFQQAPKIEQYLERPPNNLEEAQLAAANLTYARAAENTELAKLCMQYHVSEANFNKALSIKPKQSDLLPDVIIDGKMVNQPGYFLLKLPPDDPRAPILGAITNCCQSIGGHSEKCVIDGMTREHNGFYVLLKEKKEVSGNKTPLLNGRINYENFSIAGQGYAWLSEEDNLTFDSWENLSPSVDDAVIVPMLKEFGRVVTEPENASILRVTIGQGGKTPTDFSKNIIDPEIMAEGYNYADSLSQALVFINQKKIDQNQKKIKYDLAKIKKYIPPFKITSLKQIKKLEELFCDEKNMQIYKESLSENVYVDLLMDCLVDKFILKVSWILHQSHLLTAESCTLLKNDNICDALVKLHRVDKALVKDNFKLLADNIAYVSSIRDILFTLYEVDKTLVNDKNRKLLADHVVEASNINMALRSLEATDKTLVNEANFKLLVEQAKYASKISGGLSALYQVDKELVNDENRKLLADHAEYADRIGAGLSALYRVDKELVNDENRKLLADHAEYADRIGAGLSALYQAGKVLVTDKNRRLLTENADQAPDISNALIKLYQADKALVNDENRRLLAECGLYVAGFSKGFIELYQAEKALMTDENLKLLVDNGWHATSISRALITLYQADKALVTDENRKLLADHAEHALYISKALIRLYEADKTLVNDENLRLLASHLNDLNKITDTIIDNAKNHKRQSSLAEQRVGLFGESAAKKASTVEESKEEVINKSGNSAPGI